MKKFGKAMVVFALLLTLGACSGGSGSSGTSDSKDLTRSEKLQAKKEKKEAAKESKEQAKKDAKASKEKEKQDKKDAKAAKKQAKIDKKEAEKQAKKDEKAAARSAQIEADASRSEERKAAAASSEAERVKNSDITQLAETPTTEQDNVLTQLAVQEFNKSYPYKGSEIHLVLGQIQSWTKMDNVWYCKYEATIANAMGAKREANLEITIEPVSASTGYVKFVDY